MARHYDPRIRNERVRKKYTGTISDGLLGWTRVINGMWKLFEIPQAEGTELGSGYKMQMPRKGGLYEDYSLTTLTEAELLAVKALWDLAFEKALPIVQIRDRLARDAAATGDDSYSRSYRQLPEHHVRERAKRPYNQGVRGGPSDVPPGPGGSGDPDGDLREPGYELADEVPQDLEASYDEPEAD